VCVRVRVRVRVCVWYDLFVRQILSTTTMCM